MIKHGFFFLIYEFLVVIL